MNTLAEVQIGTTIVKKLNKEEYNLVNQELGKLSQVKGARTVAYEDTYLVIEDSDYDALIDFNNGDVSVVNNDNVSTSGSSPATSCKYGKTRRKFFNTASGKKIKAIIKVPQPRWGWNGKVKSKVKSYKKKWYGWKKWRTKIDAGAKGTVYSTSCGSSDFHNLNDWEGERRRKKLVYTWRNPYWASHIVEEGGMKGQYKQNGIVKELALTW